MKGNLKFSFTLLVALSIVFGLTLIVSAGEHTGAWLDEVIIIEEPNHPAAITRLEQNDIQIYTASIADPVLFQRIVASPVIQSVPAFGSYNDITFNPVGPVLPTTGKLNPFSVPRIREAMNWLIDRDYIVDEIYGGLGATKYFLLNSSFPDYARCVDTARVLELEYAYNKEKADQVVSEEMRKIGAERINGIWHYNGEPVELKFLIRNDDLRLDIGDYMSSQLEDIGFVVDRMYRSSAEAGPIWMHGNPADGQWHLYTGGWITTLVSRDQSGSFEFFYNPRGWSPSLWQHYDPEPEFDALCEALLVNKFNTMEERLDLMARAMELAMKDSVRIWVLDRAGAVAFREEIQVAADLAGGIAGSWLWGRTLQYDNQIGGTLTIASPSIYDGPFNPIGGSNWVYDSMIYRATGEQPHVLDPYTGNHYPSRFERMEVKIKEGLPVFKTLDWVDLEFVEEIQVPEDAWADWDPVEERFITVAERFPEGVTADRYARIYYPEDFFETVQWHCGSPITLADFIFNLLLTLDRGNPDSHIFDPAAEGSLKAFLGHFRGYKIVQEDPLIIDLYSNQIYLDAEFCHILGFWGGWFPTRSFGQSPWHTVAIGMMSEVAGETAFTNSKADSMEVEHLSMVAGPTIPILEEYLTKAITENHIPYANALAPFISDEEVSMRWQNLQNWYEDKGHFWVGTGPFYLESIYPIEGMVHLKRNPNYPDPADKWDIFAQPMLAELEISGPRLVPIGSEATYQVYVTFEGDPYPTELLEEIKVLLFDASGNIAYVGQAEPVEEGLWEIHLTEEITRKLQVGATLLEVVSVSRVISIPSIESIEFVSFD